jgi:hypothetical protein
VLPTTSYHNTLIRSVLAGTWGAAGVSIGDVSGAGWIGKTLGVGWGNRSIGGGAGGAIWAMAREPFKPTKRERAIDAVGWVMKFFNLLLVVLGVNKVTILRGAGE